MNLEVRRGLAAASAISALFLFVRVSQAQITGVISSDVEGFFGSKSDAYQQSEGPLLPPWPAVGFSLPNGPAALPNIPNLYAGYPLPVVPVTQNIAFAVAGGHAPASPFTDGSTTADYHIFGGYWGAGANTRDAYVHLGFNTANLMYLIQPTSAVGYAYEEEQFATDYSVGLGGLGAGAAGPRPFLIFGSFLPGGSAEFGAEVNYWWQPTIPGSTLLGGPPVFLGSLQYDDYLASVTGPFVSLVPDTYGPTFLAGVLPGSTGVLELTGDIFVIGDPVSISVESVVPEPATLALATVGMFGLMMRVPRRSSK